MKYILISLLVLTLSFETIFSQENLEETKSKEDELFGNDEDLKKEAQENIRSKEEVFQNSPSNFELENDSSMNNKLISAERTLDIGAQLYIRNHFSILKKDTNTQDQYQLSSPNLLDIYLDGRPSDRLRAYIRGRLKYDYTIDEEENNLFNDNKNQTEVYLDQMWLKFDIERDIFVTLGRQPIKWGTGYFWTPSDFINKEHKDPFTPFDERLGVNILKFHIPVEKLNWNFYGIADLDKASSPEEVKGAFRAEFLISQMEVAFSTLFGKDKPTYIGGDISLGISWFDFRVDSSYVIDEQHSEKSGQIVFGIESTIPYGENDSLILGVEYFYNESGYDNPDIYPTLIKNSQFTPLYLGKHYIGTYLLIMAPYNWNDTTFILSSLGNLSDKSFIARFDYRVKLLTYMNLYTYLNYHFGKSGEFNYEIKISNLEIASPVVDVGVELMLKF